MTKFLFWLTYSSGNDLQIVLIQAASLSEARVKVELNHPSVHFVEGRKLNKLFASHIPVSAIGVLLDTTGVQSLLEDIDANAEQCLLPREGARNGIMRRCASK